ncbi:AMP-dependent synthetase/ligase [Actinomadura hibisca]|uniref:AMP-dependent synthetase/ligase n=1 Tax=Actinomadura hibisca TaxID=68565 RepID=UPI00082F4848|nr:AMP-dependent synthetase/ligase [Actinomadura hibisca]
MREISVPVEIAVPGTADLTDALFGRAAAEPGRIVLRRRSGTAARPAWRAVTAGEFAAEVTALAKGLIAAGVEPGDRVALMSRTRYEWTLLDYALWTAGAIVVPVYETSSPAQIAWIAGDSGARFAFAETAAQQAAFAEAGVDLPALSQVWGIDAGDLDALAAAGAEVPDEAVAERRRGLSADSVATIVYTSGTTGRPKGCELTHRNFIGTARNVVLAGVPEITGAGSSTLLFLPLAHVFARLIQVACVECGLVLGHSDVPSLQADLATYQPTFLLAVPRVFEKVYNGAEQRAVADGKGKIFKLAADTAVAYSRSLETGGPGLALRLRHRLFDALVYGKLRQAMGGRLRYAMSGGAALNERLGHFFRGVGISIIEGYGLTETTAPVLGNRFPANRMGTVGRPFPGTDLRVADDGEIMVRGISVFPGYWNDETATKQALDGGWFRTGDLGALDADGHLKITGRKKEILVTAGGKNVAPGPLEDLLRAHPLIGQAVVVGDGRTFVAALVTLDPEAAGPWARRLGLPDGTTVEELRREPAVRAEIDAAVAEANTSVSHAEAIKKYDILAADLTEESGHLTPSLKIKRHVVARDFAAEIDALYG